MIPFFLIGMANQCRKPSFGFSWLTQVMLTIALCAFPLQGEKLTVRGLDIIYDDGHQIMIASGNAQLIHPQFSVYANIITFNKAKNLITGLHNVELIQENQIILSDSFEYNTQTNQMVINNLAIELTTQKKNQQIYAKATTFTDNQTVKKGRMGRLTTCGFDPPHYYFEAESFSIYPNKRIIGQNVRLVNPIFFIPFGFWSPAYVFELGKRKIIYLMPVMGTNQIEGGFLKSQIDYVINDYWTGEAFVDYLSNLGMGLGSRLNYTNYDHIDGAIYFYGIPDTEYDVKEWRQTVALSDESELTTGIQSKNMYLINGGQSSSDEHMVSFEKKIINGSYRANYQFNQANMRAIRPQTYRLNFSKQTDDGRSININYNHAKAATKSDTLFIQNQGLIGYDVSNTNTLSYYQNELAPGDLRYDSHLKLGHEFSKKIKSLGHVRTSLSYYFDTDKKTVTTDVKNHIVQKIPEIDLQLNSLKLNTHWSSNQSIQYGYYDEYYYIESLKKQRQFSNARFSLTQSLNGGYDFHFLNGQLTLQSKYNQYYYSSGDQTFSMSLNSGYKTNNFSFLKTTTTHTRAWVPANGNTPFYFDQRNQLEKNEFKETITLYILSPEKYAFSASSGYNWIVDYQLDNQYKLLIRPNQIFRALFRTTYLLQQKKYSPLASQLDLRPSKLFKTSIQANYDLNTGEMINLNHVFSGSTSRHWENRWLFDAYFTFSPKYNQAYQLQTLSLTKDLHERKLTLMYNRIMKEFRFQFTINAFPQNNIGFTSNKYESFRLEGMFNDESIQR